VPGGTLTVPPPAFTHARIAAANAPVFNVIPSATAPYWTTENVLSGKTGIWIDGMTKGRPEVYLSSSPAGECPVRTTRASTTGIQIMKKLLRRLILPPGIRF
jgi:hypothetical protein